MTALLELLKEFGPWILGAVGVLFGWLRHKQAQTDQAQAAQKVAESDAKVAQADAIQAKANEDAARAGADNAKVRRDEDADAGAVPDAGRVLHDEWGK
ncbi:hypothetical protein ACUXAV_000376 [Cupriavidus metallidurans]|uniref:hypothetical protein n=1 Tax=Cupriavidus metallidurans TaxID=119219 RepID=UPI0004935295|nr:hypothetical protein [Cupriavidus metallidurans]MDE4918336.1 hypothetical protein [Cupriavidus metallidurans]